MNYLLVLLLLVLKITLGEDTEKPLNIMGLLPMTGEKWPGGAACLTAAEMAARHIKEQGEILKGFKLNLTLQDGAVSVYFHYCNVIMFFLFLLFLFDFFLSFILYSHTCAVQF